MRGLGSEIVLLDTDGRRAAAEADDLLHAVPFVHPIEVRAGGWADLSECRVVLVTAGSAQAAGESRLALAGRNAAIVEDVMRRLAAAAPGAIVIVATNPVDVMTHLAIRCAGKAGVPPGRVFGSGTMLDTARFRTLLGVRLGIDAQHVHGYVVGEHGDSEVLTWSAVTVAGLALEEFCRLRDVTFTAETRAEIDAGVRGAAYRIIAGKHATNYGIGAALARLVDVVLHDHRAILTVSARSEELLGVADVSVSLPRLVGGEGVLATLPLALDGGETEALRASAAVVRAAIARCGGSESG
jgi:L-lactate dehydrogenase